MKIAIVVDSSSGLTKEQAHQRGWFYLPLSVTINNQEYLDGIDLNSENIFSLLNKDSQTTTSATPIGIVQEVLEDLSNRFDKVLVYPISQFLSSQYQNVVNVANNYSNVYVIPSQNVAQLIILDLVIFEQDITKGLDFDRAVENLLQPKVDKFLLVPKYNDALVKGGRLTPQAAAIAKLLKIVPVIKFEKGKLEKEGIGRVFEKTLMKYLKMYWKEYGPNAQLVICHSNNPNITKIIYDFQELINKTPFVLNIPPVIAIHTGIEAVAFGILNPNVNIDQIKQMLI